jgi:hypothetical protein
LFSDETGGNNAFRTFGAEEAARVGEVETVTVAGILHDNADASPFIVKIDIEGFESTLFESDTSWLDEFPVVLIEIHDWMIPGKALSRKVLKALTQVPRDVVISGENLLAIRV